MTYGRGKGWRLRAERGDVSDTDIQRFARVLVRIAPARFTEAELIVLYVRVVELVPAGRMAERLGLSRNTVGVHLAHVIAKLGLSDRVERRHTWAEPLIAAYWREVGRDEAAAA